MNDGNGTAEAIALLIRKRRTDSDLEPEHDISTDVSLVDKQEQSDTIMIV